VLEWERPKAFPSLNPERCGVHCGQEANVQGQRLYVDHGWRFASIKPDQLLAGEEGPARRLYARFEAIAHALVCLCFQDLSRSLVLVRLEGGRH
jgi:hypothetical protein